MLFCGTLKVVGPTWYEHGEVLSNGTSRRMTRAPFVTTEMKSSLMDLAADGRNTESLIEVKTFLFHKNQYKLD